ncbi:N-acetyltransferase family protein [Leptothrix sp. BB-4]
MTLESLTFRVARPEDAPACVDLRGRTRENRFSMAQLAAIGVTETTWGDGIADGSLPGHLAFDGERLVGYCFGAPDSGEIVVLALLPDWEGRGLGRHLLDLMVTELRHEGHRRLFLGCSSDPATRSHGFYRHLGWRSTGTVDAAGDEVLELLEPTA